MIRSTLVCGPLLAKLTFRGKAELLRGTVILLALALLSPRLCDAAETPAGDGASPAARTFAVETFENLSYYDGPDRDKEGFHTLDLSVPKGAKDFPVLIFVHGGAWTRKPGDPYTRGRLGPHNQGFASRGVAVASISYRLSPAVAHPAHVEDLARAVAWVKANIGKYGGDSKQIYLTGHSAGGHLVALVVTDPKFLQAHKLSASDVRGVMPLSGVFELSNKSKTVFPTDEIAKDASPVNHVRAGLPPFLVFAGDTTDKEQSLAKMGERFVEKLKEKKVAAEFVTARDRDHSTIVTKLGGADDPTTARILRFIAENRPRT